MKLAAAIALAVTLSAAGPVLAQAASPHAEPKAAAFIAGLDACEDAYTGAALGLKAPATSPGPFARRGFETYPVGDEAKVGLITVGDSRVYRASPAGQGQVFVALATDFRTCRVGAFGLPGAGDAALAHLQRPGSPWSPSAFAGPQPPGVTMKMFEKTVAGWKLAANLSYAQTGEGPQGLTALVTVALTEAPPPPAQP